MTMALRATFVTSLRSVRCVTGSHLLSLQVVSPALQRQLIVFEWRYNFYPVSINFAFLQLYRLYNQVVQTVRTAQNTSVVTSKVRVTKQKGPRQCFTRVALRDLLGYSKVCFQITSLLEIIRQFELSAEPCQPLCTLCTRLFTHRQLPLPVFMLMALCHRKSRSVFYLCFRWG